MSQKSYDGKNSLYLIPTPIGNLDDITNRSIETLKMVDVLFCEDTRVTRQLLSKLKINKKLISSNDHTEEKNFDLVVKYLQDGKNVGLVTDRGTPIISDPGYKIVEYIIEKGYNIIALPGATALIPALISSGISPSPFMFYGFLNSKKSKKEKELDLIKKYPYTMIFYEAPHRIIATLQLMMDKFGDRKIAVAREISKMYEEIYRGTFSSVIEELNSKKIKGEFVIVVEGNREDVDFSDLTLEEHIKLYTDDGYTEKEAMKKVAKDLNVSKSEIYKEYHRK